MGEPGSPRRLRLAMLVESLGGGGAERVVTDLALGLDPASFEVAIAAHRMPVDWETSPDHAATRERVAALRAAGVRVVAWRRTSKAAVWQWRPLAALLTSRRIEVLHAHKLGSALWGVVIGRACRVPVIVAHDHGASAWPEGARRLLYRHVVGRLADRVVAVSRPHAELLVNQFGVPAHKVVTIINGIGEQYPKGTEVRSELGVPPDAPLIVTVAMLRPEKGVDLFVRAIARLRETRHDLRAVIVGGAVATEPQEPARLGALVRELALDGTVHFVGLRSDIPDWLAAADVGVTSSTYEGTPIAVLEYMEAGIPIVATDVGGVPDVLRDGVDGLLVSSGDHIGLAAAIDRLLTDRALARSLSASGRRRRRRDFTLAATVGRVTEVYRAAAAERGLY